MNANLANLQHNCRFTLGFRSTIRGTVEVVESKADIDLPLESSPQGLAPHGIVGSGQLNYGTRDVGPPKVVGDAGEARHRLLRDVRREGQGRL